MKTGRTIGLSLIIFGTILLVLKAVDYMME